MLLMHVFLVHLPSTQVLFIVHTHAFDACIFGTFLLMQVLFIVHTHASDACIFWILAFMCKCFLSFIHMLLMHVFLIHLLLTQVLFIFHTHVSDACIFGTFAFNASAFYCPCTCFRCIYFLDICF